MSEISQVKWPDAGPGPWDDEPDELDFEAHGLPCHLQRNAVGAWCGYVGVCPDHALHGVRENEQCEALNESRARAMNNPVSRPVSIPLFIAACKGELPATPEIVLSVHGAISITRSPTRWDREGAYWWFGFDCSHVHDLAPRNEHEPDQEYRTLAYAKAETEKLAEQLAAIDQEIDHGTP